MYDTKKLKKLCSNFKVLLVDDEEAARTQVYNILVLFFHTVLVAKDGVEALEIYKETNPDLVITDLTMPRMGGLELTKAIRNIFSKQKIIVISAHTETDVIISAIKNSIDGYILKPIEAKQLFESVEKAVVSLEMQRENFLYQKSLENTVDKQSQQLIDQLQQDTLTGLPNKEKLNQDFKTNNYSEIILLNIDNFSQINSAYGYDVGDLLLKEIAKYLQSITSQTLYSGSSDEFFLTLLSSEQNDALSLAQTIKEKIYTKQFIINDISIRITFSIGIVPISKDDKEAPYAKAKHAIYERRKLHKNSIGYYSEELETDTHQQQMYEWANRTKLALDFDLLLPYYQPIVDIFTGEVQKYECLARILEQDTTISPYYFIQPAKIAGMIIDLTRRIILKAFQKFSGTNIVFSINITDDDFKENYLVEYLQEQCQIHNIKPTQVILEVLENISGYDAEHAIDQIDKLKNIGFQISIDDFGAENSNFARVQKLNVDYIKIDGAFIKDIAQNYNSLIIVKTIIFYAKHSNIKTVAEFVHDEETYNIVKELGVDYAQGYYFSEPLKDVKTQD